MKDAVTRAEPFSWTSSAPLNFSTPSVAGSWLSTLTLPRAKHPMASRMGSVKARTAAVGVLPATWPEHENSHQFWRLLVREFTCIPAPDQIVPTHVQKASCSPIKLGPRLVCADLLDRYRSAHDPHLPRSIGPTQTLLGLHAGCIDRPGSSLDRELGKTGSHGKHRRHLPRISRRQRHHPGPRGTVWGSEAVHCQGVRPAGPAVRIPGGSDLGFKLTHSPWSGAGPGRRRVGPRASDGSSSRRLR